ncbi:hypothetical protein [Paraglaciecola sp.]|uniref:hypothetical protein n=1 Tax=Paraglaciecola sp. TaxID=1920173 RepID=UPI0030F45ED7
MKLASIFILGLVAVSIVCGCSTSTATNKFAQLEKNTADYCTKFNRVNQAGKQVLVTTYSIKMLETHVNGNRVETTKTVDCS